MTWLVSLCSVWLNSNLFFIFSWLSFQSKALILPLTSLKIFSSIPSEKQLTLAWMTVQSKWFFITSPFNHFQPPCPYPLSSFNLSATPNVCNLIPNLHALFKSYLCLEYVLAFFFFIFGLQTHSHSRASRLSIKFTFYENVSAPSGRVMFESSVLITFWPTANKVPILK